MLLGDLIEKIAKTLGLERLMSDNCGCGKRKKRLNRWHRRIVKRIKNRDQ